jgi:choice-of-anchor B domain-containing protein
MKSNLGNASMTLRLWTGLGALGSILALSFEAGAGPSENVIFHANLDQHGTYANIWGYTAPDGREYALLGCTTGLAVINVSDPDNPYETGFISGPTSSWREIKTHSNYAYVVNEAGGGLQIVNLANPENPTLCCTYNGFTTAHTLYIDEASSRAFINGSDLGVGGVRILSLANPQSPTALASWEQEYIHDTYVKGNYLYGAAIYVGQLKILNISNLLNITNPATIANYPNAFTHNAWTTDNQQFVMTTDETSASACRMWNISNLASITQTDFYKPNASSIPHNAHIEGNFAYISHYTLGVKVVDVSDPYDLTEVGSYDTYPASDGGTFDGCWGVFPYFETTPGLIVASDIQTGLYVLEYLPHGDLEGQVTKTGAPSVAVKNGSVKVVQTGTQAATDASGHYSLSDLPGSVDVQVSAFAYETKTVPATIVEFATTTLDVTLDPVPGGTISGTITDDTTALPVGGATIAILDTPLAETSGPAGTYLHGSVPTGSYAVQVAALGYNTVETGITMSNGAAFTLDVALTPALINEDFETANAGWTVSGNATLGQWQRGDPQGTFSATTPVQPEDDHTAAPGTMAWVTGLNAGTSLGSFDVDGGATILTSPVYDFSSATAPHLSYWRWYSTGIGATSTDPWVVQLSADGGSNWNVVETLSVAANDWENVDVAIASLVPLTNQVRFRFTAQDTGAGSITEAALDDFRIYDIQLHPATGISNLVSVGSDMKLAPGYPNPFRAGEVTSLALTLPQEGQVEAGVYDVLGRRIATIERGVLPAGIHRLHWGGRLKDGGRAPAGVYFLKVVAPFGEKTRKLTLVR